jgi:hypothetical protein
MRFRQLPRQSGNALSQAVMVIGNGAGEGTGLMRFKHCLQSGMFIAHLILGHLTLMLSASYVGSGAEKR